MPHSRRHFVAQSLYAITYRVREGLPLVATNYMKLIIGGIIARVQRDNKVTLCHDVWMGNHPHLLAVSRDADMLSRFYGEVQKQITDAVKKLLGLKHLCLWEGRPVVARITDLEAAIDQVVYLYANPARANLVDSISEYPGLNSYSIFKNASNTIGATHESTEYWVPSSLMLRLPEPSMRLHKDLDFTEELQAIGCVHKLVHEPNAWMQCFGISEPQQVAETNERILKRLQAREEEHRAKRRREKKSVLGERALRVQSILKSHTPAESERRVYVISSIKEERIAFIKEFQKICQICKECFQKALRGITCTWPPGTFRPSLRHAASALY